MQRLPQLAAWRYVRAQFTCRILGVTFSDHFIYHPQAITDPIAQQEYKTRINSLNTVQELLLQVHAGT